MRRSVIEAKPVTAAIGRAYEVFPRTDDAMLAITFALVRDANVFGDPVEGIKGAYTIELPGKISIALPTVRALYTVRGPEVTIHTMRIEHDGVIFHSSAFESEFK